VIEPYSEKHVAAVKSLNVRLAAGGVGKEFLLPEAADPYDPEAAHKQPVYRKHFVAVENGAVRGGYLIQWQDFWIGGKVRRLGGYQFPLSEGIIDKKYTAVGMLILNHAIRANSLLFTVGMGGLDLPLPRMLKAAGWRLGLVPFRFHANHASRFFRQVSALRTTGARRMLMDALAITGIGWAGMRLLELRSKRAAKNGGPVHVETVREFAGWADEVWERSRDGYHFVAVRNRAALRLLYPLEESRYIRLKMLRGSEVIGWVVALDSQMRGNKHFGDLRVGTILDCLAPTEHAAAVIRAAADALDSMGVDLTVSNQQHGVWLEALEQAGFLAGPSNYGFGTSKALTGLLGAGERERQIHLTRGDGDGRVNL